MKIAYILTPHAAVDRSNGIRSQAVTWAEGLREKGHQVDYINQWEYYDWQSYDAIHFFGNGSWVNTIRTYVRMKNPKCVYSPIYDTSTFLESHSQRFQKKLSNLTHGKWNSTLYHVCREYQGYKFVLARSEYEREWVHRLFDVPLSEIAIVPLAYSKGIQPFEGGMQKEPFVFHMSLYTQPRKNVTRLIEAAKKYGFQLVIAGKPDTRALKEEFDGLIADAPNVKILGFISEDEKKSLYQRAKVFALPSISEGVGIVALDAAVMGADVVVTKIGGPKEYYSGMAEIVNPYDVDEIGKACIRLLEKKTYQPQLQQYVTDNYSPSAITDKLIEVYNKL